MRQVDSYLSVTWGRFSVSVSYIKDRMTVICQLPEADRLLSVSYMGQVIGVC
jgi:hypothetical protein